VTIEIVERLKKAERDGLALADAGYGTQPIANLYGEAALTIEKQHATIESLVKALEPFAALATVIDELGHEDNSTCEHRLAAIDLRRARAEITKLRGGS
jgi:hypothetical protein